MAFERKPPRGGKPGGKFGGKKPFGGKSGGGFKKPFGDKPKRSFRDDGDDRPKRDFGDRPKRSFRDDGDTPRRSFRDRDDGFKKPRRDFGDDRPKRSFDDKPRRPRRDDGDTGHDFAPRRAPRGDFGDRPKRDFGDRPKRDFGDKPRRSFRDGDDRPKRDFGDRPKRSFDDRDGGFKKPRRDFGDDRPRRSFDDRPPRRDYKRDRDDNAGPDMAGHELVLYGVHAVQAALRNPNRTVKALWVTDIGQEKMGEAFDDTRHPKPVIMERRDIERKLPEGAVHQGLAAVVEPLSDVFLTDIVHAANLDTDNRHVVVILDEVTDPHNVGAVLRSMSAFGAKAMIVHKHNAPNINGVMAKIATGAVEHVPMIPVVNIAGAMEELKKAGFFVLGLDENADYPITSAPSDGHICLVLGAEGEGLRAKTRTTCDAIAGIPTFGDIKSLNVSNAAAISLFAVTQKKD